MLRFGPRRRGRTVLRWPGHGTRREGRRLGTAPGRVPDRRPDPTGPRAGRQRHRGRPGGPGLARAAGRPPDPYRHAGAGGAAVPRAGRRSSVRRSCSTLGLNAIQLLSWRERRAARRCRSHHGDDRVHRPRGLHPVHRRARRRAPRSCSSTTTTSSSARSSAAGAAGSSSAWATASCSLFPAGEAAVLAALELPGHRPGPAPVAGGRAPRRGGRHAGRRRRARRERGRPRHGGAKGGQVLATTDVPGRGGRPPPAPRSVGLAGRG